MMHVLKEKAYLYKDTPVMGRTHGMHAEITSFGLKFALWYEDFKRLYQGFLDACHLVEVSKFSGAVGNYAANHPDIEAIASKKLGLKPSIISTQVLQRDRHARYIAQIALIGSELEKNWQLRLDIYQEVRFVKFPNILIKIKKDHLQCLIKKSYR